MWPWRVGFNGHFVHLTTPPLDTTPTAAKLEKNEAPLVTAVVLALYCVLGTRPLVKFYLNVITGISHY